MRRNRWKHWCLLIAQQETGRDRLVLKCVQIESYYSLGGDGDWVKFMCEQTTGRASDALLSLLCNPCVRVLSPSQRAHTALGVLLQRPGYYVLVSPLLWLFIVFVKHPWLLTKGLSFKIKGLAVCVMHCTIWQWSLRCSFETLVRQVT